MNKKTSGHLIGQASEQSEAILKLLTKRGIVGDGQIDDEQIRAAQQKKRQYAYHNTELLLRQYRNLAWMMECFPNSIAEELEQPFDNIDEMIDRLDVEMSMMSTVLRKCNKVAV